MNMATFCYVSSLMLVSCFFSVVYLANRVVVPSRVWIVFLYVLFISNTYSYYSSYVHCSSVVSHSCYCVLLTYCLLLTYIEVVFACTVLFHLCLLQSRTCRWRCCRESCRVQGDRCEQGGCERRRTWFCSCWPPSLFPYHCTRCSDEWYWRFHHRYCQSTFIQRWWFLLIVSSSVVADCCLTSKSVWGFI